MSLFSDNIFVFFPKLQLL